MKQFFFPLMLAVLCFDGIAQTGVHVGNSSVTPLEMFHVDGAILLGTTNGTNTGSIRWNGTNFQGYNGSQWLDLDQQGGTDTDWTISSNDQYSAVSGNVGIGTISPAAKLDVNGQLKVSGSNPAARLLLEGYSAAEGGELQLNGGASYTSSAYAIDNYEGRLRVLKTTNADGTGSLSTEMFSVKSTGQVGIGNIAGNAWPSESVFIVGPQDNGSEGGQIQFYNSNGAGTAWFLDVWNNDFRFLTGNNISGSSANVMQLTNAGNLTTSGNVRANTGKYYFESGCDNYLALQSDGNAVIYNSGGGFMGWASGTSCSDIRLKENIIPLENVLQNLVKLSTIRYTYKPETNLTQTPQIGVVAQELAENYPEVVRYNKELDQYLVYYDKLSVLLLKGLQEQQQMINEQNEKIAELTRMLLEMKVSELDK